MINQFEGPGGGWPDVSVYGSREMVTTFLEKLDWAEIEDSMEYFEEV